MQLKTWPFLKLAFALGLLGLLLGAGFARLLPSEYVSKATLQIIPATIDESMIQSTVTNSLNERILNQSQRPAREIARRILQFRFGIPTPQRRSTPSLRSLTGSKKNPRY